jgi:osmotically inducible protein OsmC
MAGLTRRATAVWRGGIRDGKGQVSSDSGVLTATPYSYKTRFEGERGTNPEELIAAAHAGCFAMALSAQLGSAGLTAESIEATAAVTLEKQGEGFAVTASHLEVTARIPGADPAAFQKAAEAAKAGCPISKLLNTRITMNARLG